MSNVIQILEDAKTFIENGWTKGDYTDGEGCYCAIGACRMAASGSTSVVSLWAEDGQESTPYERAIQRLTDVLPGAYGSIPTFNDAPETTLEDVLALFDRAIANEDE